MFSQPPCLGRKLCAPLSKLDFGSFKTSECFSAEVKLKRHIIVSESTTHSQFAGQDAAALLQEVALAFVFQVLSIALDPTAPYKRSIPQRYFVCRSCEFCWYR